MDIRQQIEKFDAENKPFYMVDHEDGVYSLCLPLSSLKGEYYDFKQEAFNQYAIRAGEPVTDGRFYTHGDGYEWEYVFAKAFEGEENLKKISFDCEAGGFRTEKKHSTGRHRTVHKENKKNKLRSREGTGISACSFIACRDGHKYFLKPY